MNMKKTLAVFALGALGVSSAQQCPIPEQTYLDFDFSNVLGFCRTFSWMNACADLKVFPKKGLDRPTLPSWLLCLLSCVEDLRTIEGCDRCYAALVDIIKDPSLDYLDTNTSFEQFGLDAADLLERCQDNFVSGLQADLGFSALQLRGLEDCGFEFGKYPNTIGVVQQYYESKGVDISKIQPWLMLIFFVFLTQQCAL